jgi:hypothetical protein
VLERLTDKANPCAKGNQTSIDLTSIRLERDDKLESPEQLWDTRFGHTAPDNSGLFTIGRLQAGEYRFGVVAPNDNWYLKAIGRANSTGKETVTGASATVVLNNGQRLDDIVVTLGEGAASLTGRLATKNGQTVPRHLMVQLVPAERERADDPLRFFETEVDGQGAFSLKNIAPGKYWVLSRPSDVSVNRAYRSQSWTAMGRAKLLKEALIANDRVELSLCGTLINHLVPIRDPH